MFKDTIPIFVSTNLNITEKFYEKLEFLTQGKYPDYLILERGETSIHFSLIKELNKKTNYCACYLIIDNIDSFYTECSGIGCVHPNGQLSDQPWGREFSILDPDWNLIKVMERRNAGST